MLNIFLIRYEQHFGELAASGGFPPFTMKTLLYCKKGAKRLPPKTKSSNFFDYKPVAKQDIVAISGSQPNCLSFFKYLLIFCSRLKLL